MMLLYQPSTKFEKILYNVDFLFLRLGKIIELSLLMSFRFSDVILCRRYVDSIYSGILKNCILLTKMPVEHTLPCLICHYMDLTHLSYCNIHYTVQILHTQGFSAVSGIQVRITKFRTVTHQG
jgi:hypothetical protein